MSAAARALALVGCLALSSCKNAEGASETRRTSEPRTIEAPAGAESAQGVAASDVLSDRPPYRELPDGDALKRGELRALHLTDGDAFATATIGGARVQLLLGTRDSAQRWRPAVAAYRLSRALGLDAVPLTVARSFSLGELLAAADDESRLVLRELLAARPDGRVAAAVTVIPADTTTEEAVYGYERVRWERVASHDADVSEAERANMDGYVAMLVLDYVAGNLFRRTVEEDVHGKLWLLDNRGTFAEHPDPQAVDQTFAKLKRVRSFPVSLRESLARVDEEALVKALEAGPYDDWLVQRRPLREMVVRTRAVRSLVEAVAER